MALRFLKRFIKLESASGIVLFGFALAAIIIDNTPLAPFYQQFIHAHVQMYFGDLGFSKPFLLLVNDGLMTLFFLLVGLEVKRELMHGELNTFRRAIVPGLAAFGGMLVPALIYMAINWHDSVGLRGWAIPAGTDTAFALAILSLLGRRIPVSLKIFLTALAIFDDIGAILVMAVFYSSHISFWHLELAAGLVVVLIFLNHQGVSSLIPYFAIGFVLWIAVLHSGVHATLVGIIVAMAIPSRLKDVPAYRSPLNFLEKRLHPVVAFFVLPIFAFANAGISFSGLKLADWLDSIPVGVALGLFLGKQVGIWGVTMLTTKLGIGRLPNEITPLGLYGLSLVAGVGFTMSLFIGTLAFHSVAPFASYVRMGVIAGSVLSGICGYWMLRFAYPTASRS